MCACTAFYAKKYPLHAPRVSSITGCRDPAARLASRAGTACGWDPPDAQDRQNGTAAQQISAGAAGPPPPAWQRTRQPAQRFYLVVYLDSCYMHSSVISAHKAIALLTGGAPAEPPQLGPMSTHAYVYRTLVLNRTTSTTSPRQWRARRGQSPPSRPRVPPQDDGATYHS